MPIVNGKETLDLPDLTYSEICFLVSYPRYMGCLLCWVVNFRTRYFRGQRNVNPARRVRFLSDLAAFSCEHGAIDRYKLWDTFNLGETAVSANAV